MATIGSLVVDLTANTSKFNSNLNKSGTTLKIVTQSANRLQGMLSKVAVAAGGVSFLAMTKSAIASGDNIHKLGLRLGATTEALSQYQHVAELSGVSFNTLTTAWQRMGRRIGEATYGTGEARGALDKLGISIQDIASKRPSEQFEMIADSLSKIENIGQRNAIAMKLFDSEGLAVVQTMTKGAAGIRKMREEADKLGKTLTQGQAESLARVTDSVARLKAATTGLSNTIAIQLGPSLEASANFLAENMPSAVSVTKRSFYALIQSFHETRAGIARLMVNVNKVRAALSFGDTKKMYQANIREWQQTILDANIKVSESMQGQLEVLARKVHAFKVNNAQAFSLMPDPVIEQQLMQAAYQRNLDFNNSLVEVKRQTEQRMTAISQNESSRRIEVAQNFAQVSADIFGNLSRLKRIRSQKDFLMSKRLGRLEIILNGAVMAARASAWGAKWGGLPGAIAAGTASALLTAGQLSMLNGSTYQPSTSAASINTGFSGGSNIGTAIDREQNRQPIVINLNIDGKQIGNAIELDLSEKFRSMVNNDSMVFLEADGSKAYNFTIA